MKALHIIIHGRVQGVFFRKYTFEKAVELKLKGIVRNLQDGSVEAFVQGDSDRLQSFVEWCHRGSPLSKVETVEVVQAQPSDYSDFRIVK